MPRGRKPEGEQTLSNTERQARHRARQHSQNPMAVIRYLRPADRRNRPQRWHEAVAELLALQVEYTAWLASLPNSLHDSPTAEALETTASFDLDALTDIDPPRG